MEKNTEFHLDTNTYLNILTNLPGMFYRCHNDENWTMIFVSDGCEKITGYKADEFINNKTISYESLVHLDDRERLRKKCSINLANKKNCNNEYRIICRKGKTKWVRELTNGIYDSEGNLLFIEGLIQEITYEKAKKLLVNSYTSYQDAVNTGSIVSITDLDGTILYVNRLFCNISKYSQHELIGRNHNILNSEFHDELFFAHLWKTIKKGKIWRGEVKNKAKDGTFCWLDTVISPVLNEKDQIIQFISIRNDITTNKLNEESLITTVNELKQTENLLYHANKELIKIEEKERSRISFEIHDGLMQTLATIKLHLDVAKTTKQFKELDFLIEAAIVETREIINNLYPKDFFNLGLMNSLKLLFQKLNPNIQIHYHINFENEIDFDAISQFKQFNIYRLLQECLNNTLKHSNATEIRINFSWDKKYLYISYFENGTGISIEILNKKTSLIALKRRLNVIPGEFSIETNSNFLLLNFKLLIHHESDLN